MSGTVYTGDARSFAATLAPCSVQAIITSPPYYRKRSYLPADHPNKQQELGTQGSVGEYVTSLIAALDGFRAALKADGTLWLNIGDTFKDKALLGVPWRVAFGMQERGWLLRSEIIWHKPNATPESVKDRPSCNHEMIFLFAKGAHYYYNGEAVREPVTQIDRRGAARIAYTGKGNPTGRAFSRGATRLGQRADGTRNRRSVWTVNTRPYPGAHVAVFPPELVRPCILAATQPGDLVCDPFVGSGVVPQVAVATGRKWVAGDLDPRAAVWTNARIAGKEDTQDAHTA